MTAFLDPNTADKLAKVCALFGSDHDGERANAAAQAHRLLRASGLSWFDVLQNPQGIPKTNLGKIRFAMARTDMLTFWERGFLLSIRHKADRLSEKQLALLDEIIAEIGGAI